MPIVMSKAEIDETMNKAADAVDAGSKWPGMSYEQGVLDALRWVTGEDEDNPMDAE